MSAPKKIFARSVAFSSFAKSSKDQPEEKSSFSIASIASRSAKLIALIMNDKPHCLLDIKDAKNQYYRPFSRRVWY